MNKHSLIREIIWLVKKDTLLEIKQRYAINGLILYVVSTVFVCYLSFKKLTDVPTWNALFWIILLFTALNTASKGFASESRGRILYYYSLSSAKAVILSRMIYNGILMLVISLTGYLFYGLLIGNIVQDEPFFLLSILLGSAGFSSVFTLIAAIASRTGNVTLMAIMSFPVIMPLLIMLIRFSKNAVDGLAHSVQYPYIYGLLSINIIVIALATIMFPYIWRE